MVTDDSIGKYVLTPKGLGRCISIENQSVAIEFIDVVGCDPVVETFPQQEVTNCDWRQFQEARTWVKQQTYGWLPGRFQGLLEQNLDIKIRGQYVTLPESNVLIRWDNELEDCEQALAQGMNDSKVFYEARMPVVENFVEQRNKCRGYTAALSAPVRIFPHQLNVLARVLGDPIRRFVLADEVGLGKTIEAGLIIRQLFLDDPHTYVVVAVPRLLKKQWTDELEKKLLLGDQFELGTLQVISFEEILTLDTSSIDMLVVDEAHQLTVNSDNREFFSKIENLVREIPGLLLLTATPLRGNADTFYDLLRLIDSVAYPDGGYEKFAERLAQREEEADNLELLVPETDPSLLKEVLKELEETYPTDNYLEILLRFVENSSEDNVDELSEKLRSIRDYLRETYRLSRRVIRNRRTEAVERGFKVSGRTFEFVNLEEPTRGLIDDFLEQWRLSLQNSDDEKDERDFRSGLEHALAGPEVFLDFISEKLEESPNLKGQLEQVGAGIRLRLAEEDSGMSKRWEYVVNACTEVHQRGKSRCVVFTSFASGAEHFVDLLRKRVGPNAVEHHLISDTLEGQELAVQRFLEGTSCRILVCDQSAEEGRNLQDSESIFHLDLPLSINRLEQRIGRTDRFRETGSSSAISITFNELSSGLVNGHLQLLSEAVGVFDGSVATLHHPLADLETEMQRDIFRKGISAFDLDLTDLKEKLDQERDLIEYLEFLESSSSHSDMSPSDIYDFEDFEESWGDIQEALELLVRANGGLSLKPYEGEKTPGVFTYNPVGKNARTLPLVRLDHFLDIAHEFPYERTFNRVIARKSPNVRLMRLGDPLVNWVENYLRIDDRGRARVLWLFNPKMSQTNVAYRFDFQIEFDDKALREEGLSNLRRRGDIFFPPITMGIWVANGRVAEGKIEERFDSLDTSSWVNIRGDRWSHLLEEIPNWTEKCLEGGKLARQEILQKQVVSDALQRGEKLAQEDAQRRKGILTVRIERAGSKPEQNFANDELEKELKLLAAIEKGIVSPSVRMIAAGAHVMSPREIPSEND